MRWPTTSAGTSAAFASSASRRPPRGGESATFLAKPAYARSSQDGGAKDCGIGSAVTRSGDSQGAACSRADQRSDRPAGSVWVALREHRAVYRVGHRAPSLDARYLAAVRACGEDALLCGLAAAYLYGLLRTSVPPPEVVTSTERRIVGVRTVRSRRLDPREATVLRGIPITTVPRTLVDMADRVGVDRLARACHEAGVRYGTTPRSVEAVLAPSAGSSHDSSIASRGRAAPPAH